MEKEENGRKWREISCFENCIGLKIPEELIRPSDEMVSGKFPYVSKPQEIYMDADGQRILTLNLLEKSMESQRTVAAIYEVQRLITHIYPESIYDRAGGFETPAGMAGWFSYVTGGMIQDNSHVMFVISVYGRMMLGSYHVPADQWKQEKNNFLDILESIEIKRIDMEEKLGKNERGRI